MLKMTGIMYNIYTGSYLCVLLESDSRPLYQIIKFFPTNNKDIGR